MINLELPIETADALVVNILRAQLTLVRAEIAQLSHMEHLLEHEQQDLTHAQDMQMHLCAVIKYFSTPDEWPTI